MRTRAFQYTQEVLLLLAHGLVLARAAPALRPGAGASPRERLFSVFLSLSVDIMTQLRDDELAILNQNSHY